MSVRVANDGAVLQHRLSDLARSSAGFGLHQDAPHSSKTIRLGLRVIFTAARFVFFSVTKSRVKKMHRSARQCYNGRENASFWNILWIVEEDKGRMRISAVRRYNVDHPKTSEPFQFIISPRLDGHNPPTGNTTKNVKGQKLCVHWG